jgi:hypothetical protein
MPTVEITTTDSPAGNNRSLSVWGLVYIAVCYGVSFLLPAYEIEIGPEPSPIIAADYKSPNQRLRIPGWVAFRLSAFALLNPKLEAGQRLPVALMMLANVAFCVGFLLGLGSRRRASALAALVALCCGASCLFNTRLVLGEFRAGYYMWLGSFALLGLLAVCRSLERNPSAHKSPKPK